MISKSRSKFKISISIGFIRTGTCQVSIESVEIVLKQVRLLFLLFDYYLCEGGRKYCLLWGLGPKLLGVCFLVLRSNFVEKENRKEGKEMEQKVWENFL